MRGCGRRRFSAASSTAESRTGEHWWGRPARHSRRARSGMPRSWRAGHLRVLPAHVGSTEGGAMVARVASFEDVNVQAAERTMDEAETIIRPLIEGLTGYKGHLELLASDGKVLSITLFDSEENAQAAEPTFDEEMPRRLGDLFEDWEGRRISVDRYTVLSESRSY